MGCSLLEQRVPLSLVLSCTCCMFLKGYFAACVISESNASVSAWDKILGVLVAFFFSTD